MSKTDIRCDRCGRTVPRKDWATINAVYLNGRVVQRNCLRCQTPEERAEAEHNLASGATASRRPATDSRILTADQLAARIEATPDDGELLMPTMEFAECGARWFIAFDLSSGFGSDYHDENMVVALWPWDEDPALADKQVHNARDGSSAPLLKVEDGEMVVALVNPEHGGTHAYMELPIVDWMGLDPVATNGVHLLQGLARAFGEYLDSHSTGEGGDD